MRNYNHTCYFHTNNTITNFCTRVDCTLPMCDKCLPIHLQEHGQSNVKQKQGIVTFNTALQMAIKRLQDQIQDKKMYKTLYTEKIQNIRKGCIAVIDRMFLKYKNVVQEQFACVEQLGKKLMKIQKGSLKTLIYCYTEQTKEISRHIFDQISASLQKFENNLKKSVQSNQHHYEAVIKYSHQQTNTNIKSEEQTQIKQQTLQTKHIQVLKNEITSKQKRQHEQIYIRPRGYSFNVHDTATLNTKLNNLTQKEQHIRPSQRQQSVDSKTNTILKNEISVKNLHKLPMIPIHKQQTLNYMNSRRLLKTQANTKSSTSIVCGKILPSSSVHNNNEEQQRQRQIQQIRRRQQMKQKQRQIQRIKQQRYNMKNKEIQKQNIHEFYKQKQYNKKQRFDVKLGSYNNNYNYNEKSATYAEKQNYRQTNGVQSTPYERLKLDKYDITNYQGNRTQTQSKKLLQVSDLNYQVRIAHAQLQRKQSSNKLAIQDNNIFQTNKQVLSPEQIRKMLQKRIQQRSKIISRNKSTTLITQNQHQSSRNYLNININNNNNNEISKQGVYSNNSSAENYEAGWDTRNSIINQIYQDYKN